MGFTYEDIERVNKDITYTPIERYDKDKGKKVTKNYAEVAQRVMAFRKVMPMGFITPQIVRLEGELVVIKATCGYYESDGSKVVLAEAHAFEIQSGSKINKTSYIENCETSAVGRALGLAGFGGTDAVSSKDEVEAAMAMQAENDEKWVKEQEIRIVSQKNVFALISKINERDRGFWPDLCNMYDIKKVSEIKNEDFPAITELARNKLRQLGIDEMELANE